MGYPYSRNHLIQQESTTKETKKKNKVSLKAKRESMKAADNAQLEAPVTNGKPAENSDL